MTEQDLQITGLAAGYPRCQILHDLTLPVLPAGTITAVIGPNGTGKTTLLRALAGLLPTTGEMQYRGQNLLSLSLAERARHVTYMPQNLPQGVGLTVIEAVLTALRVSASAAGHPESDLLDAINAVLHRLEIGHLALSRLDELSGGQRQLVSLAQAVIRRPGILLLDEPTSALDPRHQIDVMAAVQDIARADGMIVLVVLHDLNLALRWADTVILIADGRLAAAGPPQAALTSDTLASCFRIAARIEHCSRGYPHVILDGKLPGGMGRV